MAQPKVNVQFSVDGLQNVLNALREAEQGAANVGGRAGAAAAGFGKLGESAKGVGAHAAESAAGFEHLGESAAHAGEQIKELAKFAAEIYIAEKLKDAVTEGVNFNREMENATTGIATLLSMQTKIVDSHGNMVTGAKAYDAAMGMAQQTVNKLRIDAQQTAMTTAQLVDTFKTALPMAMQGGITNLDQIEKLVVNISRLGSTLNINSAPEMRAELEGVFTGQRRGEGKMVGALGLDPSQIAQWKQQGDMFQQLQTRLEAVQVAAAKSSGNFDVLWSSVKDVSQLFAGDATQGLFGGMKESMKSFLSTFVDETGNIAPAFRPTLAIVNSIGSAIGSGIGKAVISITNGIKEFGDWTTKNKATIDLIGIGFSEIGRQFGSLISDVTDFHSGSLGIASAWEGIAVAIAGVRDGLSFIADTTKTIAGATMQVAGAATAWYAEQRQNAHQGKPELQAEDQQNIDYGRRLVLQGSVLKGEGVSGLAHIFAGDNETQREIDRIKQRNADTHLQEQPGGQLPPGVMALPPPELVNHLNPSVAPSQSPAGHPLPPVPMPGDVGTGANHSGLPGLPLPPIPTPEQAAQWRNSSQAAADAAKSAGIPVTQAVEPAGGSTETYSIAGPSHDLAPEQTKLNNESNAQKGMHDAQKDLEDLQSNNAKIEKEDEASLARREMTQAAFNQRKLDRLNAEWTAEQAILSKKHTEAEALPTGTVVDNNKRDTAIRDVDSETLQKSNAHDIATAELSGTSAEEKRKAGVQYKAEVQKLDKAGGDIGAVGQEQVANQVRDIQKYGQDAGIPQTDIDTVKARATTQGNADTAYAVQQQKGKEQFSQIDTAKASNNLDVKDGTLFQSQADAKTIALEQERLPILQQISAEMTRQAALSKDPGKMEAAAKFSDQVKQLAVDTDQTGQRWAAVNKTFGDSLESNAEKVLMLKENFRQAGLSIVDSLQQIVAKLLVQIAEQQISNALGIGQKTAGAAGAAGAAGGATSGMGGLQGMFSSFTSMLGFKDGGFVSHHVLRKAGGGAISGAGTGTSDSIPAMLSNGEFVMTAQNTSKYRPLLEAMNNGQLNTLSASAFRGSPLDATNVVGVANPSSDNYAGVSSMNHHFSIEADEGLTVQHLKSTAGQRALVESIGTNRRAVSQLVK